MARGRRRNSAGGTTLSGTAKKIKEAVYQSYLYRLSLNGRTPSQLIMQPSDMLPGDIQRGTMLLHNTYVISGQVISDLETYLTMSNKISSPWRHNSIHQTFYEEVQSFEWLRDLRVLSTDIARSHAKKLIFSWLTYHKSINPISWSPKVAGRRVAAWLAHSDFLLKDADTVFSKRFLHSIALQTRHLSRTTRTEKNGDERLQAIKGLLYSGLSFPDGKRRSQQALCLLDIELQRQILPDGSHYERSPSAQLTTLRHLIDIQNSLENSSEMVSRILSQSVERMAPVLRAYRHGDGSLALFNDSIEEEPWLIDLILAKSTAKGRTQTNIPDAGFQRVQAGRTLLITDHGCPTKNGHRSHAGTLSFELSIGKERLIVNCGPWHNNDNQWRSALRATAAHSTLTINDTNSCELYDDGTIGIGPTKIIGHRADQDGATWLEASHDGYFKPFGLIHKRRIYISTDGTNVRGEDSLTRTDTTNRGGRSFAIRFHLHPNVKASLVQDGNSILLRTPSGNGWQMRASGGTIGLNESTYSSDGYKRRRAEQAVITGAVESEITIIKWALQRIAKN